jgi:hypothetical protein
LFSTVDTPAPEVPRDQWQRPLIVPPGGGDPVAYTRCTTYVKVLDDQYALQKWLQRKVAVGLSRRPDLLLSAAAHEDDNTKLDEICQLAAEAAEATTAATTGTALHRICERIDNGEKLPNIPKGHTRDIRAYQKAMEPFTIIETERFGVLDELQVGGTWDRVIEWQGRRYIGDLKTGKQIARGILAIAMQLAVYANSTPYSVAPDGSAGRQPRDYELDTSRGLVIHLPAGTGKCHLHWVDLDRGWEAVKAATLVRWWRRQQDISVPFDPDETSIARVDDHNVSDDQMSEWILTAPDEDALGWLWSTHGKEWDDRHRELATARMNLIKGGLK